MSQEVLIFTLEARRKGRSQAACTIEVAFTEDGPRHDVVLRTIDASGVEPFVALLTAQQAADLGVGLIRAAEHADE